MYWIKEIQKLFNIDAIFAREIYDRMYLDFSEASQEEFEREAQYQMDKFLDELVD